MTVVTAYFYTTGGRITGTRTGSEINVRADVQTSDNAALILEGGVISNIEQSYINGEEIVPKRELTTLIYDEVVIVGNDLEIHGLPEGTTVTFPDSTQELIYGGSIVYPIAVKGQYPFVIDHPHFIKESFTVLTDPLGDAPPDQDLLGVTPADVAADNIPEDGEVLAYVALTESFEWQIKGGAWGSISGTLADQTDLQNALNAKLSSESDPTVPAHVKAITAVQVGNWNTAFGWGDWSVGVDKAFVDALNVDADTLDTQDGTYYLARANHTGTQTLATISDSGTAASEDVTTSATDTTAGRLLKVADHGIGLVDHTAIANNYDDPPVSTGVVPFGTGSTGTGPDSQRHSALQIYWSTNPGFTSWHQLAFENSTNPAAVEPKLSLRSYRENRTPALGAWRELYHTGNLNPGELGATQTWTGVNTFQAATSGGSVQKWLTADGLRFLDLEAPVNGDVNAPFIFNTGNSYEFQTDYSAKVTIDPSGNVGINTTTPTEKLDVNGNIATSGAVKQTNFETVYNAATDSLDFNYIG